MTCLTNDRILDLESDLSAVLAQIVAIDTALSGPVLSGGTKSYKFDSGSGESQETFMDPMALIKMRKHAEASRDRIRRILSGKSIMRIRLRR